MSTKVNGLDNVIYSLRSLFSGYGYSEYKMNKFEEYDLYVKNKDFLISENVITFTDTNGKLLALKPDVTLSIVKNAKVEDGIKKVFYNENVYRVSSKSNGYKEIAQIGLECIGEIDDYNVAEVITLAVESLKLISPNFLLDVSPIALLSSCVDKFNLPNSVRSTVFKCVNEKNVHELQKILFSCNASTEEVERLCLALQLYGNVDYVIKNLKVIFADTDLIKIVSEFENTLNVLPSDVKQVINIDCSSCENAKYYNSITFKGYVNGIPKAILSGGRYDGLLKRMGKNCKALGFAVYPDEFDRMFAVKNEYDVDVVVEYSNKSNMTKVLEKVNEIYQNGKRVTAVKTVPAKLTYKEKIEI